MNYYNINISACKDNCSLFFKKFLRDECNYSLNQIKNLQFPLTLNNISHINIEKLDNLVDFIILDIINGKFEAEVEEYFVAQNWYNSLEKKEQEMINFLIIMNQPHAH